MAAANGRLRMFPLAPHTSILCSLANHGYQLGRELNWDPNEYEFPGDKEANALLNRPGRGPWKLA